MYSPSSVIKRPTITLKSLLFLALKPIFTFQVSARKVFARVLETKYAFVCINVFSHILMRRHYFGKIINQESNFSVNSLHGQIVEFISNAVLNYALESFLEQKKTNNKFSNFISCYI